MPWVNESAPLVIAQRGVANGTTFPGEYNTLRIEQGIIARGSCQDYATTMILPVNSPPAALRFANVETFTIWPRVNERLWFRRYTVGDPVPAGNWNPWGIGFPVGIFRMYASFSSSVVWSLSVMREIALIFPQAPRALPAKQLPAGSGN